MLAPSSTSVDVEVYEYDLLVVGGHPDSGAIAEAIASDSIRVIHACPPGPIQLTKTPVAFGRTRAVHVIADVSLLQNPSSLLLREGDRTFSVKCRAILLALPLIELPLAIPGNTLAGVVTGTTLAELLASDDLPIGTDLALVGASNWQALFRRIIAWNARDLRSAPDAAKKTRRPKVSAPRLGRLIVVQPSDVDTIEIQEGSLFLRWRDPGRAHGSVNVVALMGPRVPDAALARLLGCRLRRDDKTGALVPVLGPGATTSCPGVFAVMETPRSLSSEGLAKRISRLGAAIADHLSTSEGFLSLGGGADTVIDQRGGAKSARLSLVPFTGREEVSDLAVACRCEGVTVGAVRSACRMVDPNPAVVKRVTRAGMGRCQGRYCELLISALAQAEGARDRSGFTPRMPLHPIPLGLLANVAKVSDAGGHSQSRMLPDASFAARSGYPPAWGAPLVTDTCIVGGGIVGSMVGLELARRGMRVVVLDGGSPADGASGSNAGTLHVQLLAEFRKEGAGAASPQAQALVLGPMAINLWRDFAAIAPFDIELTAAGGLVVAETDEDLAFLEAKRRVEERFGVPGQLVGADDLARLEPSLSSGLKGASHCPLEGHLNPLKAFHAVRRLAEYEGVRFEQYAPIRAIEALPDRSWSLQSERGRVLARRIVNCAGPWAPYIAGLVGKELRAVAGVPWQMIATAPAPSGLLSGFAAHASGRLSLKQARSGGVLVGGGWPGRFNRASGRVETTVESLSGNAAMALRVMPSLATLEVVRAWGGMGVVIDGAPILGEFSGTPNFFNCVAAKAVTLAPALARLTADLMVSGRSDPAARPFLVSRFERKR